MARVYSDLRDYYEAAANAGAHNFSPVLQLVASGRNDRAKSEAHFRPHFRPAGAQIHRLDVQSDQPAACRRGPLKGVKPLWDKASLDRGSRGLQRRFEREVPV